MKNLALVAVLSLLSSSAFAGQSLSTKIADIRVDASGVGYVSVEGTVTSRPACGTTIPKGFAFNLKTEGGRALLSTLMAARLAGRPINVFGSNTCTVYGANVEDIDYIQVG